MKNLPKNFITTIFLFVIVFSCYSQETQYELPKTSNLIFNGTSIVEAVAFEKSINSKPKKPFATITLSTKLYPYAANYTLANPKEFLRNSPKYIPASIEYFYDRKSNEVKYISYKWDFIFKVSDDILFDRNKLKKVVEKECKELEAYTALFSELDKKISLKYNTAEKSVKINKQRTKKIAWKSDTSTAILSLEFQDCTDKANLLPGYFVVHLIEYSK